ncbi:MAG: 3-isopropylmalate dehydratase small subunit [Pseudomonadota bacterium]
MQEFTTLTGVAAPLGMANIDTDMIIPKQFLKTIQRQGLAKGLFYELRYTADGAKVDDFILHQPVYQNAEILVAGPNFGCGSSREHAPWALLDFGIRCVIAPSFADIFYNNCFKNGVLPITLPQEDVDKLLDEANGANHRFAIDLEAQTVSAPSGAVFHFDIDPERKVNLLNGCDDIDLSLQKASSIDAFEAERAARQPWLATSA